MFRATNLSIYRSIRLYTTACGMFSQKKTLPVRDLVTEELDHQQATFFFGVQHTTNCSVQSNVPVDGQNFCPKHVELIWIYQ